MTPVGSCDHDSCQFMGHLRLTGNTRPEGMALKAGAEGAHYLCMVVSNVPLAKGHPSTKAIFYIHIRGTLYIEPGEYEGHIREGAVNSKEGDG